MNAITTFQGNEALTASQILDDVEILTLEHESEDNSENEEWLISMMKKLKKICGEHAFAQWPDGTYAFIKTPRGGKSPNPSQIFIAYHTTIAKERVEDNLASWPLGDASL